jgi:hypothetical protein
MSIAAVPNHNETHLGHVRRGVIVPDSPVPLVEGAPVRFEMLPETLPEITLAEKLKALDALVKKWDEEDAHVTDDEVKAFLQELEKERGLRFHSEKELEALLLDDHET